MSCIQASRIDRVSILLLHRVAAPDTLRTFLELAQSNPTLAQVLSLLKVETVLLLSYSSSPLAFLDGRYYRGAMLYAASALSSAEVAKRKNGHITSRE